VSVQERGDLPGFHTPDIPVFANSAAKGIQDRLIGFKL
jgi:hypothetical protein